MDFGYITNGFRDHRLEDVLAILAELGYRGVGITLDVGHLDPLRAGREEVVRLRESLRRHGLRAVVETGGRFVLDPRRKHWPTLIGAEGRERRLEFLRRGLEVAEGLGAPVLSFWSGARDPSMDAESTWKSLMEGIRALVRESRARGILPAFEPEPGMFVPDLAGYRELRERLGRDAAGLKLTLDAGHLQCTEEPPHARWIEEFRDDLANVHLDDVRKRVHEHLFFGEGEVDFPALLAALERIGYAGLALVELSRHSHAAPDTASRAMAALRGYLRKKGGGPQTST